MLSFVLDQNLGPPACDEPWTSILAAAGIAAHQPDIATSKFTGDPRQCSLLVVRADDPPTGLDTLIRCGPIVLEDVWKTTPANAKTTKIIGRYDNCKPPVVIVREDLDEGTCATLLDALVAWVPDWNGVYGALKPFYYADAGVSR